jgi:hypothetical protein
MAAQAFLRSSPVSFFILYIQAGNHLRLVPTLEDFFLVVQALKVPSTIVHIESNFILNPLHPEFNRLQIGSPQRINFDPRIANLLGKIET